jgi:hypothetical protein
VGRDIQDSQLTRVTEIAVHPRWPATRWPPPNDPELDLVHGERVHQRIVTRAATARRERFRAALERGHSIEDIAAATGLKAAEVRGVLAR